MKNEDKNKEPKSFGDTELGENLGCGFLIIAIGIAIALISWADSLSK